MKSHYRAIFCTKKLARIINKSCIYARTNYQIRKLQEIHQW